MMFVIPGNSKYLWNAVEMSKDNVINNIKNEKKEDFKKAYLIMFVQMLE